MPGGASSSIGPNCAADNVHTRVSGEGTSACGATLVCYCVGDMQEKRQRVLAAAQEEKIGQWLNEHNPAPASRAVRRLALISFRARARHESRQKT